MARPANIIRPVDDVAACMQALGQDARAASVALSRATTADKNAALLAIAEIIASSKTSLAEANGKDLTAARQQGLSGALLDRLELDDQRILAMAEGLRAVAALAEGLHVGGYVVYRPDDVRWSCHGDAR